MTGTGTEIERSPRTVGTGRVLRAVFSAFGRPVRLNALALSVALGIPSAILFASNGLRSQDVVAWAHASLLARCLLWAGWLALSAPALRALFEAPGSRTLRALRLPRAALVSSLFLLAALPELPWAILFARGAGPVVAWGAVSWAIALGASSVAALRRRRWQGLTLLGAVFVAFDPPPTVCATLGSVCAPWALHAAWRCALEQPSLRWQMIRPAHPIFALYAAHLLRLTRAARSRLMVALLSGAGGAIGLLFSLRNDPTERPLPRALTAMALPLTLAAAACVAPVIESEARLRGLLRSLRTPRACIVPAFLLAIATPSSALAATAGVVASGEEHLAATLLAALLVAWALTLSFAVAFWGRLLEWRSRRSAGNFAAGVTLIAAAALLLAFTC